MKVLATLVFDRRVDTGQTDYHSKYHIIYSAAQQQSYNWHIEFNYFMVIFAVNSLEINE